MPARATQSNADTQSTAFVFGVAPKRLRREDEATAGMYERIESAWGWITELARRFFEKQMSPHERANFGLDDLLSEILAALIEKDSGFDPGRGVKYATWATTIASRAMLDARDKAHTVHCPTNTSTRLRKAERSRKDGNFSDAREASISKIHQARAACSQISHDTAVCNERPGDQIEHDEEVSATVAAAKIAIRTLDPYSALLVGQTTGIWGQAPKSCREIARLTGASPCHVAMMARQAKAELRRRILEIRGLEDKP